MKTLKEIRRCNINRRRKRAGNKIKLRQHQREVNKCNLKTCMVKSQDDTENEDKEKWYYNCDIECKVIQE